MEKEFELKFVKDKDKVIVSGFKNKEQIRVFIKLVEVDWS